MPCFFELLLTLF